MQFEITSGNPTPEELAAIEAVMAQHKREELTPVIVFMAHHSCVSRCPIKLHLVREGLDNNANNCFSITIY